MRLFSDSLRIADPYLHRAAELALRARGATAPNPLVGCVVVRDDAIVGEGFHPRAGAPHAEVFALAHAGERARGADVYVTLEPCNHHGRTPPCAEALIAAGVARVVIGMPDPTPQARGGATALRDHGIDVEFAADPTPFAELNEGWLKRVSVGLPLVTAKVGASLDGRVSLIAGGRSSMTGPHGARVTQMLRAASDAVLVGAATVIADDPALTVRDSVGALAEHQPLRVVLVRGTCPPRDARLFTDGAAPTLVIAGPDADERALAALPANVLVERLGEGDVLEQALALLGSRGVNELLVEPGPRLFGSLVESSALDRLVTVYAGGIGGPHAVPMSAWGGSASDALAHPYSPVETGIVGDVSVTVWRPSGATGSNDKE